MLRVYESLYNAKNYEAVGIFAQEINPDSLLSIYNDVKTLHNVNSNIFDSYQSLYDSIMSHEFDIDYDVGLPLQDIDMRLRRMKQWIFYTNDIMFDTRMNNPTIAWSNRVLLVISILNLFLSFKRSLLPGIVTVLISVLGIVSSIYILLETPSYYFLHLDSEHVWYMLATIPIIPISLIAGIQICLLVSTSTSLYKLAIVDNELFLDT